MYGDNLFDILICRVSDITISQLTNLSCIFTYLKKNQEA